MKLNKILALALSGVMAISMLAGCSTNKDDNNVVVTPSTGAAVLNANQDALTFTDSTSDNLQKATSILSVSDISSLRTTPAAQTTGAVVDTMKKLDSKFEASSNFTAFANNKTAGEKTVSVLYAASGALTMEAALKEIAKTIDGLKPYYNEAAVHYAYSYTGNVSTVTATSVDGTVSANYILVTVTQTVEIQK